MAVYDELRLSPITFPTMHNVPIGFGNIGFIVVEREEWIYRNGNINSDLRYSDCLPWEKVLELATQCPHKCLPVVLQSAYKDLLNLPKCHSVVDHQCMFNIGYEVKIM